MPLGWTLFRTNNTVSFSSRIESWGVNLCQRLWDVNRVAVVSLLHQGTVRRLQSSALLLPRAPVS